MKMPDIFHEAEEAVFGRHHVVPIADGGTQTVGNLTTQTPAARPATMKAATAAAPQQEDTMSLATIEDDVKADLTDGLNWLQGFASRLTAAAPGIIATSEAVGGSTVGALVEAVAGRILPPQLEQILANQVKDFVDRYSQVQAAAPAPQPPAPAQ